MIFIAEYSSTLQLWQIKVCIPSWSGIMLDFFRGECCIREDLPSKTQSICDMDAFWDYLFLSFLCYNLLADVTIMHYQLKLKNFQNEKMFSLGGKKNRSINMPLSRHINIFGE